VLVSKVPCLVTLAKLAREIADSPAAAFYGSFPRVSARSHAIGKVSKGSRAVYCRASGYHLKRAVTVARRSFRLAP